LEKHLDKASYLSQNKQFSCFIRSLKYNIKANILTGRPTNLSAVLGLAQVSKAQKHSLKRLLAPKPRENLTSIEEAPMQTPLYPLKQMTLTEFWVRQEKGLSFKCNKKFSPGRQCKKLFLIESVMVKIIIEMWLWTKMMKK
jgi:hypothetical protein